MAGYKVFDDRCTVRVTVKYLVIDIVLVRLSEALAAESVVEGISETSERGSVIVGLAGESEAKFEDNA